MIKFLVPALPIGTLLAVSYAATAQAQETSSKTDDGLETVIVEAQKMQEGSIGGWIPVPLPELPRTVTIIDEEIISKQFVSSTKDILKNVAGVQIMPDNNLAGYQTPYIRGIQSNQYFEGQYSAGVITSIPEVIGGAEVLQGFNSLQFAIDTGGGSVNYFMKRPTAQSFLQTEVQGTNWGGAKFILDGNMRMGPGETDGIRFVGVLDRDQSYVRDFPRKEGNAGSVMMRYSGLLGIQIDLDVSLWDIDNDPNNQFISFGAPPVGKIPDMDPRTNLTQKWSENANRKGNQLGFRAQKEFGNWRALAAVAYDRTTYRTDGCNQDNPNFITGEVSYYCSRNGFGPLWDKQVRFDLSGRFDFIGMQHQVAMGWRQSGQDWKIVDDRYYYSSQAPYNAQNLYNPRRYPVPGPEDTVLQPSSFYRSSFDDTVTYFQDRISVTPKWDVWAGVGYVENDGYHGVHDENKLPLTHAVIPTGAVVFKPSQGANYYFSYSEGLSRAELTSPNDPQLVNPGVLLPAVHSKAYEVGAKWIYDSRLFVNLAVFNMEQPYTITEQVSDNPVMYKRYEGGLNEFKGVSIDVRGKILRNLDIQGGFTVLDPKQKDSADPALEGNRAAGVSERSGALNLTWDLGASEGLSLDAGVYYQDSMPLNVQNTYTLDGFTRFDLGGSYDTQWNENELRFRVLLENVLDDEFYYGFQNGIQLAAPRTLNASVALRF
jgi:iron complex outermembrane receptor protein